MLKILLLVSSLYAYPKEADRYKYHIGVSMVMTIGSYSILKDASFKERIIHSLLASTVIGTSKEYVDYRVGGYFDRQDVKHNALGSLIGGLLCLTYNELR